MGRGDLTQARRRQCEGRAERDLKMLVLKTGVMQPQAKECQRAFRSWKKQGMDCYTLETNTHMKNEARTNCGQGGGRHIQLSEAVVAEVPGLQVQGEL